MASLLTVALHGKLEYFTDILKTLLNDLVEQYVAKNPKLMLRRWGWTLLVSLSDTFSIHTSFVYMCVFSFFQNGISGWKAFDKLDVHLSVYLSEGMYASILNLTRDQWVKENLHQKPIRLQHIYILKCLKFNLINIKPVKNTWHLKHVSQTKTFYWSHYKWKSVYHSGLVHTQAGQSWLLTHNGNCSVRTHIEQLLN